MTVRWSRLPDKLTPKLRRPRAPRTSATWRCVECGEVFTVWKRVEEHVALRGHKRIEQVLDVRAPEQ